MKVISRTLAKKQIAVEISLLDGSILFASLSVSAQERLTDLLNDERAFLPVECANGSFVALAKRAIKQVSLPVVEPAPYRGDDPYMILGVPAGASQEELRMAYRRLCAIHHPDRIRGLGLGEDHEKLATQNMIRFNDAYERIAKAHGN